MSRYWNFSLGLRLVCSGRQIYWYELGDGCVTKFPLHYFIMQPPQESVVSQWSWGHLLLWSRCLGHLHIWWPLHSQGRCSAAWNPFGWGRLGWDDSQQDKAGGSTQSCLIQPERQKNPNKVQLISGGQGVLLNLPPGIARFPPPISNWLDYPLDLDLPPPPEFRH